MLRMLRMLQVLRVLLMLRVTLERVSAPVGRAEALGRPLRVNRRRRRRRVVQADHGQRRQGAVTAAGPSAGHHSLNYSGTLMILGSANYPVVMADIH